MKLSLRNNRKGGEIMNNSNLKLKVGDVVILKSGGPEMTADRVERESVHCCWFSGERFDEVKYSYFNPNSLQLVKKERE